MSNTRDTGFLGNVVKVDSNGDISLMHGSTMLMQISSSGAVTTTGVISGSNALTSSYSQNSELLDNLDSTSFVFTSSFNTYSSSMSTRVGKIEGNYATTGSNVFLGAQTVCANITSTGTIIAQTLNVQQVTSSVVYSSGSNIFGCSLTNTQQFTGSVLMTGSLAVFTAGTSPEFQVAVGGNTIGNALTDVHQVTGSLRITGSVIGAGNACITSICSPTIVGGTMSGTTVYGSTSICGGVVCGTSATFKAGNGNQLTLDNAAERFTQINLQNNSVQKAAIWWDNTNTELVLLASGTGTGHLKIASTGAATFSGNIVSSYSSNTTTGNAFPRIGASNTNATQQDYNISELYVSAGNGTVYGGLVASYSSTFPTSTPSVMLRNSGDGPLYFSTNGSIKQTITSGGITCFACQVCAPIFNAVGVSRFFNAIDTSTTGYRYMEIANAGASMYYGVERSTAAGLIYNSDPYSTVWATTNATNLNFGTNLYKRLTIDCTGIAIFTCQVCAPTFVGSLSGNASTATNASTSTRPAATATRSGNFSSGTVNGTENVDISSYYLPYFGPVWFYFNASYNGNGAIQANWLGLADAHYFNNGTANIIWTDDGATGGASMPSISVSVQGSTYNTRYLRVAFTATGGYAPNNWNWTFGAWNAFP